MSCQHGPACSDLPGAGLRQNLRQHRQDAPSPALSTLRNYRKGYSVIHPR